jgi:serine/threonine-protein kinase
MEIAMAQINDAPPAMPAHIDPKVQALILKCLEKKPFQRPANALALAIAAENLMAHPRHLNTGTSVLPNVRMYADETTLISTNTAQNPKPPVVWPWIAVIILLSITAISLIVALIIGSNRPVIYVSPDPSTSQFGHYTPPPSVKPTASATPIAVNTADILGKGVNEVSAYLSSLGLEVATTAGDPVPADDPRLLTVYQVDGITGQLQAGDTVNLTYYVQQTDNPSPLPSPTQ